jgi:PTS system galactitol-specific IIA component
MEMKVHEFLKPEAICLQLDIETAEEVIRLLGTRLHTLGYVKDGFIEATLKREENMPTGLPLGGDINAAIPHVDIEFVNQPALALATLKKPVIFQNMVDSDEAIPVRLVIMLALDQPKSQITMLQEVSHIFQQPEIVRQLVEAHTPEDVFKILSGMSPAS